MKILSRYEANITQIRVNEEVYDLEKVTDASSPFKLISWTGLRYVSFPNFMEIDQVLIQTIMNNSFRIAVELYINISN